MSEKEIPVKCKKCRKTPKNCDCAEYRVELAAGNSSAYAYVYADNVATEPTRGEQVGTWQPRANARIWRRPQYVDSIIVLYLHNAELYDRVKAEIEAGTFNPFNYKNVEGARVPDFPKENIRRFAFLRRAKQRALAAA